MDCLQILPETLEVLKNHKVEREKMLFGYVDPPIMVECDFKNGVWEEPKLVPYHNLSLDPATKVLHYAQGIFEGMKAYHVEEKGPYLFRPVDHYLRFILSSQRLDIPEIPKEFFIDAVEGFTKHVIPYIPTETRNSLYLRPFIIATENGLGANSSKEFKFVLIGKVSKPYFEEKEQIGIHLERNYSRVGKGCTGSAKAISNYASGMKVDRQAKERGCKISLWLDSSDKQYIEELSGMHFFIVCKNYVYTPAMTDSILPGITRDCIFTLAKDKGYHTMEATMDINDLLENIDNCSEMFAVGTTATVMPISYLRESTGHLYYPQLEDGPVTRSLRESLLAIQEGRSEDPYGWVRKVT